MGALSFLALRNNAEDKSSPKLSCLPELLVTDNSAEEPSFRKEFFRNHDVTPVCRSQNHKYPYIELAHRPFLQT